MDLKTYDTKFFKTKLKIKNYPEKAQIYKTVNKNIINELKLNDLNPAFMDMNTIIKFDDEDKVDELIMFYDKNTGGIIPRFSFNKNIRDKTIQMLKIALDNGHDSIIFDNFGNHTIMMNICEQFSKLFKEIVFISDSDETITSFNDIKNKEIKKDRRKYEKDKTKMLKNRRKNNFY